MSKGVTYRRLHLLLGLQQAQGHRAHWVCTLNLQPGRQQHLIHLQDQHLQKSGQRGWSEGAGTSPGSHTPTASPSTGPLGDKPS